MLYRKYQTRAHSPLFGQTIACLNNLILGLAWRLGWRNLDQARRHFDAHPEEAFPADTTRLT